MKMDENEKVVAIEKVGADENGNGGAGEQKAAGGDGAPDPRRPCWWPRCAGLVFRMSPTGRQIHPERHSAFPRSAHRCESIRTGWPADQIAAFR